MSAIRAVLGVLLVLALWASIAVRAQTPSSPTFEAASIRQNLMMPGPTAPQRVTFSPDRLLITNESLRTLIRVGYPDARDVVGGPQWAGVDGPPSTDVDRYDVNARAAGQVSRAQLQLMLQALLKERFKLAFHIDSQPQAVWALVLARADGRLGPNLRPAQVDCQTLRENAAPQSDPCGNMTIARALITGTVAVRGQTLQSIRIIERDAGRPLVDRTGLTGTFDIDLRWTPQSFLQGSFDRDRFPNIDPSGPSIFTALQEQLGLKLVPEQGRRDVFVIDHVERPTEN